MTSEEYQDYAKRTLLERPERDYRPEELMMIWTALGLAGEAGECADNIKKAIFHDHGIDRDKLKYELGDCLWYLTCLAGQNGFTLEEVMITNINKLEARYPDKFATEASRNRKA